MKLIICFLLIMSFFLNSFTFGGRILDKNYPDDQKESVVVTEKEDPSEEILFNKQYFQDIFSNHFAPLKIEFGHVYENPEEWEQRYEKNDMKNKRYQGKVLWGSENGDYGEHYWDLNHKK